CKRLLKPQGIYLVTAPSLAAMFQTLWTRLFGGRRVMFGGAKASTRDLVFLRELVEAGKMRSVIDRQYDLDSIVEAHRYVGQGHKKGNVIITLRGTGGDGSGEAKG
ncbi:MAG: zinc-binding dehydrogenase, partial [Terriglobia bacterium]